MASTQAADSGWAYAVTVGACPHRPSGSGRAAGIVLAAFLLTAAVLAGCGGGTAGAQERPSARLVPPAEFETAIEEASRVTINVHVPDEGSISGTDLWIPFDEVAARENELPDPSTPLAVYCRSGRMSAIAVDELAGLGFADVVELEGGMIAWEEAGKPLLPPGTS